MRPRERAERTAGLALFCSHHSAWPGCPSGATRILTYQNVIAVQLARDGDLLHAFGFVRIRKTLKMTPVLATGVMSKGREMADVVTAPEDWKVECREQS